MNGITIFVNVRLEMVDRVRWVEVRTKGGGMGVPNKRTCSLRVGVGVGSFFTNVGVFSPIWFVRTN